MRFSACGGERLHQGLEAGMVAQGEEIGIVFDPLPMAESVADGPFQQVEGLVGFSEMRVSAGDVVEDGGLFRVDGQGAVCPKEPALTIADRQAAAGAEI